MMSFFPDTVTERQRAMKVGLAVLAMFIVFALVAFVDIKAAATSLPAAVQVGGVILVLVVWVAFGWRSWKRMPDLGELELRIQTEAAFLTQHVTIGILSVIAVGSLVYQDAFPTPTFLTMFVGYFYLIAISHWLVKRRYA